MFIQLASSVTIRLQSTVFLLDLVSVSILSFQLQQVPRGVLEKLEMSLDIMAEKEFGNDLVILLPMSTGTDMHLIACEITYRR